MVKRICTAFLAAVMLILPNVHALDVTTSFGERRLAERASENGLVPESLKNRFGGDITRLELCQLGLQTIRTAGQRTAAPQIDPNTFSDTQDEAVIKLAGYGVVSAKEDGTLGINDRVTRGEAADFLYKLSTTGALSAPYPTQLTAGEWEQEVDSQILDAVSWCVNTGILPLKDDGSFAPNERIGMQTALASINRIYTYSLGTTLNMTASGYPMLYANNPEELKNSTFERTKNTRRGVYTAKTTLQNRQIIDVEYYHWNYTGMTLVAGVAVTNNSDTDGSFTVLRNGTALGTETLDTTEECNVKYLNSEPMEEKTVAAGETVFALKTDYEKSLMINSRARIQANSPNLTVTTFVLYDRTAGPSFVPNLPRAADDAKGRTSALFPMSERNVVIDGSNTQLFTLCGNTARTWTINTGEFPNDPNSAIGGINGNGRKDRAHFLNGNYGTVYNLEIRDALGKILSIRPNDPGVEAARYLIYTEKDGWTPFVTSKDAPYQMPITSKIHDVKFLLLGGNSGNIGFCLA